jgi:hypothetical protein
MLELRECIKEFERAKERKRRGMPMRKNLSEVNAWMVVRHAEDRKELSDFCKEGWLK